MANTFTVPKRATHFTTGYCGATPQFYRLKFTHYNSLTEEYLQPMYVTQYYDRGDWVDDPTASLRRAHPISKFDEWDPTADCCE